MKPDKPLTREQLTQLCDQLSIDYKKKDSDETLLKRIAEHKAYLAEEEGHCKAAVESYNAEPTGSEFEGKDSEAYLKRCQDGAINHATQCIVLGMYDLAQSFIDHARDLDADEDKCCELEEALPEPEKKDSDETKPKPGRKEGELTLQDCIDDVNQAWETINRYQLQQRNKVTNVVRFMRALRMLRQITRKNLR